MGKLIPQFCPDFYILNPCSNPCDYAIEYEGHYVCKPLSVNYCRINETDRRYKGKIELLPKNKNVLLKSHFGHTHLH